jgi:hypothetical protein
MRCVVLSAVATVVALTAAGTPGCGFFPDIKASKVLVEMTAALNEAAEARETWEPDDVLKLREQKVAALQNQWNEFSDDAKKGAMQGHGQEYLKAFARRTALEDFTSFRPSQEFKLIAAEVSRRLDVSDANLQPDWKARGMFLGRALGNRAEGPTPPGEMPSPKEYLVTVRLTASEVFYGKARSDRGQPVPLSEKFERKDVRLTGAP